MRWWIVSAVGLAVVPYLSADDPKPAKANANTFLVPYRLSTAQHVVVRAKINGRGPFNFIVDTGAPALFVGKKIAEKAKVTPDRRGWAAFDRFEIEGGVVVEKAEGRVDDLFQLEGMNGMGLAGVELHGVIGYNILARYRIEYDFTRPKLAWIKLDFEPATLGRLGGRSAPAGLDAIGGIMKFLGGLMGVKADFTVQPRGFLGAEIAEGDDGVTIKTILADGPAAKAGLKPGDRVRKLGDSDIRSAEDFSTRLAKSPEGARHTVTVLRDGRERVVTLELGRGL